MAAPIYQLTMRSGPNPGKSFFIEKEEMLLGRDLANDIPISDPEVSRNHARFVMRDDSIVVEDLGSTNGTFLNGQRIASPMQLRLGDVITFGENIVMIFEKATMDPDATVVGSRADYIAPAPQEPQQPVAPQPDPKSLEQSWQSIPASAPAPSEAPKKGMPSWLIILLVAIVVLLCVIAVTLWFMPASWWCAITFNSLEGCPVP